MNRIKKDLLLIGLLFISFIGIGLNTSYAGPEQLTYLQSDKKTDIINKYNTYCKIKSSLSIEKYKKVFDDCVYNGMKNNFKKLGKTLSIEGTYNNLTKLYSYKKEDNLSEKDIIALGIIRKYVYQIDINENFEGRHTGIDIVYSALEKLNKSKYKKYDELKLAVLKKVLITEKNKNHYIEINNIVYNIKMRQLIDSMDLSYEIDLNNNNTIEDNELRSALNKLH